ncbi:hypothetical protein BB560_004538, partial [Smittium megazygosporum]
MLLLRSKIFVPQITILVNLPLFILSDKNNSTSSKCVYNKIFDQAFAASDLLKFQKTSTSKLRKTVAMMGSSPLLGNSCWARSLHATKEYANSYGDSDNK